MKKSNQLIIILIAGGMMFSHACVKVPADVDFISPKASYSQTTFEPVLGRTTLLPDDPTANIFNADNSTSPLTFKILHMRGASTGEAVDIFNKTFPVQVWKEAYTGLETTREEVEKKRTIEQHHLFEVREHSGQFVMWRPMDLQYLNAIKMQPDPGYKFDVEVSNSGGSKIIRDMELKPMRPQPYAPSAIDPVTGNSQGNITPYLVSSVKVYNEDNYMSNGDVIVVFHKDPASTGNTLTFEFRDSAYNPINPKLFNSTRWEDILHHFGPARFTPEAVTYDVAYPIPLAMRQTRYTNASGTTANVMFSYDRIANGALRMTALIGMNFAIYEPGDWKMVFWFYHKNPDFRDN
ncbi:uncharacterized protein DUF5007 [Chitinophaga niastensis]|uniref:Uncharacterized protein DUF5007 n=1 Tax=Chitinophaga niastensis TaxID=536980 RepID=A0A2P8HJ55_CHINA|nr:DUF5007 domain-containing protein [Chitinophaga niastensis]PSL46253.1 uncharacterized protein DUF5007 [Chitinophaga niastensis]